MSIGPTSGILASAAGVPLAQTKGSEIDEARQTAAAQHRQTVFDQKAAAAAGIGRPDGQDHETADRDPDGRLPWKFIPAPENTVAPSTPPPPDPSGAAGNLLDLSG